MDELPGSDCFSRCGCPVDGHAFPEEVGQRFFDVDTLRGGTREDRSDPELVALCRRDHHAPTVVHPLRVSSERREHGFKVEPGFADGVEHLGHRRLADECFVEIVEQLCVGDGDRCLVGKGLEYAPVARLEWPNLVAVDID